MIGEVQALLHQRVEIDLAALARDPARMLEHALDDVVGAPPVLADLLQIAGQHPHRLLDLVALVLVERRERQPRVKRWTPAAALHVRPSPRGPRILDPADLQRRQDSHIQLIAYE